MKESINSIEFIKICMKRWYVIVVAAIVVSICTYFFSSFFIAPMYKSAGQIHVKNSSMAAELSTEVTATELTAAARLGITFIEMLKNDTFISRVKNMGNFDLSVEEIRRMMVFDQPDDTAIINIRVNSTDAKLSYMLVQEILRHSPAYLEGEMQGTTVDILQEAKLETRPYSPDVRRNCMYGFIMGIVVGVIISLCMEFFNKKIENSEELEEVFGYPILGEIPNLKGGRGSGVY